MIPEMSPLSHLWNRRWTAMAGVAAALLLCLASYGVAASAAVGEAILSYASHIAVASDGSLAVTETIRVVSAGSQIKRGIFRDFPTTYRDEAGNLYRVDFTLLAVERDGRPEPYHTEALSNGLRIYVGRQEVLLAPGEYNYTLRYRTDRQLGFFQDHDELYWNVTGNGWNFPIETVSATVVLPVRLPSENLTLEGYTGPQGAKEQYFTAAVTPDGRAVFQTTRRLHAHEGFTIVVGWPKGVIPEPSLGRRTAHFLKDNRLTIASAVGTAVLFLYFALAWFFLGRDPAKGTIMPLYTPPDGLSPAAMRFLAEMGYDDKVFAAAVIDMAVKGFLSIQEKDGKFTLSKTGNDPAKLSPEEGKIAAQLFQSGASIALEQKSHGRIAAAKNALKTSLTLAFEISHFVTNKTTFSIGAVLSAAVVALTFLAESDRPELLFFGLWLAGWSIGVGVLMVLAFKLWREVFKGLKKLGTVAGSLGAALLMTGFSVPFVGAEIFVLIQLGQSSPVLVVFLAVVVAMNLAFHYLIKAPTLLGRRILDRIEGFRMFLVATEGDRLQRMAPAERTPEFYEKYLPYALALDVEEAWTEGFASVLSSATNRDGGPYRPQWYSGADFNAHRGDFTGAIGSSLSGAISSAATAPGSRSGGGGGGSSGGGGGGGGGGGW